MWTTNTFVIPTARGLEARLIDWDHAAVGPASYDLSTFLLRFAAQDRPWILDLYREAAAQSGWRMPATEDLNRLFETAECARCASCLIWPAIALVRERAAWGFDMLAEIEQWFEQMQPVLREVKTSSHEPDPEAPASSPARFMPNAEPRAGEDAGAPRNPPVDAAGVRPVEPKEKEIGRSTHP